MFKPAGGHFFAVGRGGSTTTSERKKQSKHNLLPLSVAASSYGDEVEKCAGRVKELHDVDNARSGEPDTVPVSVSRPLSLALQKVLGRFQSVFRLLQRGGLLTALLAAPPSFHFHNSKRDEALLSESDTFCMAMSAGVFGIALSDLSGNLVFMSAFWSWLTAQMMKYFTAFYREGRWDWRVMFDSGGMPSSHTSLVVGLTTGIAYQYGLGSTLFPLSLAFSLIVMYDAAGVRRHAGKQAAVLNKILENMFHGESISEDKLKEVLGHSPLQVLAGAVLGVFIGVMYMHNFGAGYAALA
jgi:acid phosphatase family membrane protein YuiD